MVKNPQLLEKLKKRERGQSFNFDHKMQRYEQMYQIACKLNPEIRAETDKSHLKHIIELAKKFKKIGEQED